MAPPPRSSHDDNDVSVSSIPCSFLDFLDLSPPGLFPSASWPTQGLRRVRDRGLSARFHRDVRRSQFERNRSRAVGRPLQWVDESGRALDAVLAPWPASHRVAGSDDDDRCAGTIQR